MEKHIYDENNGLHYTLGEDGLYYPDLALPQEKYEIGRFGKAHAEYLERNKKTVYSELLLFGRLNEYLHDIDTQAQEMYDRLTKEYAIMREVTEELKVTDQMKWVGEMNNIKSCAQEVVNKQIIYV
jgi:hypothetical protein